MERFAIVGMLCAHVVVALRPTITKALKMLEGDIDIPPLPDRPMSIIKLIIQKRLAKTEGHLASMAEAWVDATVRGEGERAWQRLYRANLGLCGDGHDDGWLPGGEGSHEGLESRGVRLKGLGARLEGETAEPRGAVVGVSRGVVVVVSEVGTGEGGVGVSRGGGGE
ncbi:unnamed protein product [Sphenostylis stenocarpa]|uniref:Uncharacterized protein n=1 Tax=Sphenostylis stenocarpa TaxID=92480 RepID=A0AA87BCM3_9FABA|nr:unnamed protein product [Sphenostylis stenocarpa]